MSCFCGRVLPWGMGGDGYTPRFLVGQTLGAGDLAGYAVRETALWVSVNAMIATLRSWNPNLTTVQTVCCAVLLGKSWDGDCGLPLCPASVRAPGQLGGTEEVKGVGVWGSVPHATFERGTACGFWGLHAPNKNG